MARTLSYQCSILVLLLLFNSLSAVKTVERDTNVRGAGGTNKDEEAADVLKEKQLGELAKKSNTVVVEEQTQKQFKKEEEELGEVKDNATASIITPTSENTIQTNGTATIAEEKKKTVRYPRIWESNANAVMKVIDRDAHHVSQHQHVEGDSEDDSEDSSDDEDTPLDGHTKYLSLPNLADLEPDKTAHEILSSSASISLGLHKRLATMFQKATSHECRVKIAEHMALFVNGLAKETKFPFQDFYFPNTCAAIPRYADWENLPEGMSIQDIQYRVY